MTRILTLKYVSAYATRGIVLTQDVVEIITWPYYKDEGRRIND